MDFDLVNRTGVTHTCTNTYSGSATKTEDVGSGSSVYSYDINNTTYQGVTYSRGASDGTATVTSLHEFVAPVTVSNIKYYIILQAGNWGKYIQERQVTLTVSYKVGADWTAAVSYDSGVSGGGVTDYNTGYATYTPVSPITSVVAIRAIAYATSVGAGGEGGSYGYAKIYEIEANGQPYNDIGLRFIDGDGVTRKIGVESTLASKLRINKTGTIYGIPLVDTTDNTALPLRIFNGSVVKSLGEVT